MTKTKRWDSIRNSSVNWKPIKWNIVLIPMLRTISAQALFVQNKYILVFFLHLPQFAESRIISPLVKKTHWMHIARGEFFLVLFVFNFLTLEKVFKSCLHFELWKFQKKKKNKLIANTAIHFLCSKHWWRIALEVEPKYLNYCVNSHFKWC